MTGSAQAVVDALAAVATPRRALIDRMEELDQRRGRWVDRLRPDINFDDDDRLEFLYASGDVQTFSVADRESMPDLGEATRDYIDGAAPDLKTIPAEVRLVRPSSGEIIAYDIVSDFEGQRAAIDKDLAEVAIGIEAARRRLETAFTPARDRLWDWLEDLESGRATPADWGRILKAWRASFMLPMRVAADVLGVSSAAIARYETGDRTPSSRDLKAKVETLIEAGPGAGLDVAQAVRSVSRLFGDRPIDLDTDPIPMLLASIEARLESLSATQLRFIDALVADSQTLEKFRLWITSAPVQLLRMTAETAVSR
jgi:transcriptional regulator with XRE-family HTH domain